MQDVGAPISAASMGGGGATPPPPPGAPAKPTRRRGWHPRLRALRRIAIGLIVLGGAVTFAPYALSVAPVRHWVAGRVSASVGRRVTIGGITARWWTGIEARDVEVHNPDGFDGPPLVAIDRVEAHVPVLPYLFGDLTATVVCERPVLTLQRTPDGRANWAGLAEEKGEPSKRRVSLSATVKDGRVTAYGLPGAAGRPQEIDAIDATVSTRAGGAIEVIVAGVARGAARGGGDAPLSLSVDLGDSGAGPVRVAVPALDLSRLSGILAALGVEGTSGTLEASVEVALSPAGDPSGTITARGTALAGRVGSATIRVESLSATLTPRAEAGGVRVGVDVTATGLGVRGLSARDEGLSEPRLAVTGSVRVGRSGDVWFGEGSAPLVVAGRTLSATVTGRVTRAGGEGAEADLKAKATATLSPTLGRLLGILDTPDEELSGALSIEGRVQGSGGSLTVVSDARVADLVVGGAGGSAPWREPVVTLSVSGTWDGRARTLSLKTAALSAGALSAAAKTDEGPFVVSLSPKFSAQGKLVLDADLARLASVRARVAALESVSGGHLHVDALVGSTETLRARWTLRAKDLTFAPGALSDAGYAERDVVATGVLLSPETGSPTLEVKTFASALATLDRASAVLVRLDPEGPMLVGDAKVVLDLGAASRAFGTAMGLAAGETLTGLMETTVSAAPGGSGAAGPFELAVLGRDVRTTNADGRTLAPGRLEARAKVARDAKSATTSVRELVLNAFGVAASGEAVFLSPPSAPTLLRSLRLEVRGDLGPSSPLLAALGVLPADAKLAGVLDGKVVLSGAGIGRSLLAHATVQRLSYVAAPGAAPFEETTASLDVDAMLDATPGLTELKSARLVGAALTASATGRITSTGSGSVLDLAVDVDGDARGLADRMKPTLGPGYEDLTGEGRLTGKLTLKGTAANGGRDLLVNGALAFRMFKSGGLSATEGRVTLARARGGEPVNVTLHAGVNGGKLDATGTVALGVGAVPWTARAEIRGLDTGPMLTGSGPGRYLPMLMPAIVPGARPTPVLSGRMDADLNLRSNSVHQPENTDSLQGTGSVRMGQGSVADSTIFRSLGAGDGLSKLAALAPGVGEAVTELGKSLLFSELSSRFEVGGRRIHLLEVRMTSPRALVKFDGYVGFDGIVDLDVPLVLGGDIGASIERWVPSRTIPLKVSGLASEPRVRPNLKLEDVGEGLLDEIKKRLK